MAKRALNQQTAPHDQSGDQGAANCLFGKLQRPEAGWGEPYRPSASDTAGAIRIIPVLYSTGKISEEDLRKHKHLVY